MEPPEVLIPERDLQHRVGELAASIEADRGPGELVVVGVLTGCFVFMADLVRRLGPGVRCEFLGLSSYGSETRSSGQVAITKDLEAPLDGRRVLVVEDIVDTGLTLSYLLDYLSARRPASVSTVSLLSKPARRRVDVPVDHVGFSIEDRFVVGYGLDHAGLWRNLPYIGAID